MDYIYTLELYQKEGYMEYTTVKLPKSLLKAVRTKLRAKTNTQAIIRLAEEKLKETKRKEILNLEGRLRVRDVRHLDDRLG